MSKKFRDHKIDLKYRYYDAEESMDFNIRNCPRDVSADQWEYLVSYWKSDKGKKAEERAKTSRAQQKVTHTSGSKSFARFGAELAIANGAEVGGIATYEATHTKKDGSYLDPAVKDILEKAKAKKIESASTPSNDVHQQEIEILAEVLGNQHYGRVSGLGMGPTPTFVLGPFSSISRSSGSGIDSEVLLNKLNDAENEISTLKRQMAQILSHLGQSQPDPASSGGIRLASSPQSNTNLAGQQNPTV